MFWSIPNFSASSPVETILDKESFTLEELLDEEEIIQECKALNTRLINFLRGRAQVEQLLRYIVEDAPEDAEGKLAFKFPFIACEIFTCEIDVILKTLVDDGELMDILFSFLEPERTHNPLLAGCFSKVVVCLMLRKTTSLMKYVQSHEKIFCQLVDLMGITSIMEILVRLVGADDHMYPNFMDVMKWLSESNLLEMIVNKLSPSCSPEVHANAAEVLGAIIKNAPSPLASKLASPSFVARIFDHALEDSLSKSALVYSLSVCISLLDPKRSASTTLVHSFRSQHLYGPSVHVDPDTISAMLPKLGVLLALLDVSSDENALPTTYGELRPPLGKQRLKIVEFLSVLLGTGDETAEKDLVNSGSIQRVVYLFFEYPFNNALHHHVENIIMTCLDSKDTVVIDNLFRDCNIMGKFLYADKHSSLSSDSNLLTKPTGGRLPPRAGYIGHITRIANKLVHMGSYNDHIRTYLQYWAYEYTSICTPMCKRDVNFAVHLQNADIRPKISRWNRSNLDETSCDLIRYNIGMARSQLEMRSSASIIWQPYDGTKYENEYDVQCAMILSRHRCIFLHDSQENAEWIDWENNVLQERNQVESVDRWACGRPSTLQDRARDSDDEINDRDYDVTALANNLNQAVRYSTCDNDDADEDVYFDNECAEVVISSLRLGNDNESNIFTSNWFSFQDDTITEEPQSSSTHDSMENISLNETTASSYEEVVIREDSELGVSSGSSVNNSNAPDDLDLFQFETGASDDLFKAQQLPNWVGWCEPSDIQVDITDDDDDDDDDDSTLNHSNQTEGNNPTSTSEASQEVKSESGEPSLFEEDAEFVGVELESPRNGNVSKSPEIEESTAGILEFNKNHWRVEPEVGVVQE